MNTSNALAVERPEATTWPVERPTSGGTHARPLGRVAVSADVSCGLGSLLTALTLAGMILPETNPGYPAPAYWAAGVMGALGMVASLLVHELGHAAAAQWAGLGVARIRLSFAAGLGEIGVPRRPRQELIAAVGGPLATLVAVIAAASVHVILVETVGAGLLATVASLVAIANVVYLAFTMMPGLPLDGGHIVRATVWAASGRRVTATKLSVVMGRGLGNAMLVLSLLGSIFGFGGIATWLAFFGLVIRLRGAE